MPGNVGSLGEDISRCYLFRLLSYIVNSWLVGTVFAPRGLELHVSIVETGLLCMLSLRMHVFAT